MSITPPTSKDKITFRWLFDHVPIAWWFGFAGLCVAIFGLGMTFAQQGPITEWIHELFSVRSESIPERIEKENAGLRDQLSVALTKNERRAKSNQTLEKRLAELHQQNDSLNKRLKLAVKEQTVTQDKIDELKTENYLLRVEIDALKVKTETANINIPKKEKAPQTRTTKNETAAKQIIDSLDDMYSIQIPDFLIEIIPRIKGGVSCDDLSTMLSHGMSTHSALVVKKIAAYVQRPFSAGCFKKLASVIYTPEASAAIETLIKSEPKY